MPDDQTKSTPTVDTKPPVTGQGEAAEAEESVTTSEEKQKETAERNAAIMAEVANRIGEAHNILIALSSDPSVDELAAAIGLSICLDRVGKRATAIYSGSTPNALEFLKPEETFETSADTLQDFVIALSKDKADHLRYKLDGDYVRIFITPYKSRIAEEDLEYSYGDFNIDLVLALDVANGTDLDAALREHGRIMHDATVINITTAKPGKFGEIEWSDKTKSSVSEMVATLLYGMGKKVPVEKEEATAFLTGIVAATEHFTNAATAAETMQIAAKLMKSGANQQLIAENITADTDNQMFNFNVSMEEKSRADDPTSLDVLHGGEEVSEAVANEGEKDKSEGDDGQSETGHHDDESETKGADSGLEAKAEENSEADDDLAELNSVAASLAAGAEGTVVPPEAKSPVSLTPSAEFVSATNAEQPEKVIAPSGSFDMASTGRSDYGKMLEEALAEADAASTPLATPIMSAPGVGDETSATSGNVMNPAMMAAPSIPTAPEVQNVPEMNFNTVPSNMAMSGGPMAGGEPAVSGSPVPNPNLSEGVLPPPPMPPVNVGEGPMMPPSDAMQLGAPAPMPSVPPAPVAAPQPEVQPMVQPAPENPGAFKIPGM